MIRGILFDFDGTLADTLPICLEAFRQAVEHHGGERLADEEIRSKFGPCETGVMTVLVPEAPVESLASYHRLYEELHDSLRSPFDGLAELLGELRRHGIKLGVVTGKGEKSLEISLRLIGLDRAFDALEPGCPYGPCKPEGILRILADWKMKPQDCLYVGDSIHDVSSARLVGMPIASVSWADPSSHETLGAAKPDFLFDSVEEFRSWILSEVSPDH